MKDMKDRSIILIAAVALVLTLAWYALPVPPDQSRTPPPPVVQSPTISTPAGLPPAAIPSAPVTVPVAPPAETPKQ